MGNIDVQQWEHLTFDYVMEMPSQIYQAKGCEACRHTGYKGRVGIYEVMKVTPEISRIIMEDGNALQIAAASEKAGFNNLRRSGLKKVIQGITSLQEVNRVTSE